MSKDFIIKFTGLAVVLLLFTSCSNPLLFKHVKSTEMFSGELYQNQKIISVRLSKNVELNATYCNTFDCIPSHMRISMPFDYQLGMDGMEYQMGRSFKRKELYAELYDANTQRELKVYISYSLWGGRGYGIAKDNKGNVYNVLYE